MADKTIDRQEFSLRLEKTQVKQLDLYAKKLGISRNQLISKLLDIGLDDVRLLDSVGLLMIGKGVRSLVLKIRDGDLKLDGQRNLPI